MGTFTVTVATGNAAFDPPGPEIARILRDLADRLTDDGMAAFDNDVIRILDYNGNHVGFAAYDERDPTDRLIEKWLATPRFTTDKYPEA